MPRWPKWLWSQSDILNDLIKELIDTNIPKDLKKYSEKSFEVSEINTLLIKGEGKIKVQLIGAKNPEITVEVYGEEGMETSAPGIVKIGRKAFMKIPASSKKIIYRLSLPEDMDIFLFGEEVFTARKNMTKESLTWVTTKHGSAIHYPREGA